MKPTKQIEKAYHDKSYSEGVRASLTKYYSVDRAGRELYRNFLYANCNNRKILEYGCGTGNFAYSLVNVGAAHVTGIDISEVAIEKANLDFLGPGQTNSRISFCLMDAESLAFAECSFDIVCGTGILHHLNLENVFSEMVRVLKYDGMAVFVEPLGHNPFINLYRRLTPAMRTEHEHPLLLNDLCMLCDYFEMVDVRFFNMFSLMAVPFRNVRWFRTLLDWLEQIDSWVFKHAPFLRKYAWQAVIILSRPRKAS